MKVNGKILLSTLKLNGIFHLALGAIDSKHVAIRCTANTDAQYFNYKETFGIVFLP